MAGEGEADARQLDVVAVAALDLHRLGPLDAAARHEVAEPPVELGQLVVGGDVLEAEHGEVVSVTKIRRQVPVEEYLRPQKRFAHLFGEPPRTDVIARVQAIADRNVRRFDLVEAG